MIDELDAPDVRKWMHETLTESTPELNLAVVMREGLQRRRRARMSIVAVTAVAVVGVGVLTPTVLSAWGDQNGALPVGSSTDLPSPSATGGTTGLTTPTCRPQDFTVSLGGTEGTAGTFFHTLRLTSRRDWTCVVDTSVTLRWGGGDVGPTPIGSGSFFDGPAIYLAKDRPVSVVIAAPDPANFGKGCRTVHPTTLTVAIPARASRTTDLAWDSAICLKGDGAPRVQGFQPG
jgi:hypothetical protein